jgi:hypothetical protein
MATHPRLSPTEPLTRRWRRFLLAKKKWGPWQEEELEIYLGGARPRRLFYFTQHDWCINWFLENRFPKNWHVLSRYSIPTESYLATIRRYCSDTGLPIHFIGDLDPRTLAVFAALRYGDPYFQRSAGRAIPVRYMGVDDRWYELCEQHLVPGEEITLLKLDSDEQELWPLVKEALPDVRELVGQRCFEILESGRTLTFFVALGPSTFSEGFHDLILRHLSRAPGRPAPARTKGRR